jgi:ABC-type transport system involved in cytochrome c biogenesis permease component
MVAPFVPADGTRLDNVSMVMPPIIERELRAALHKRGALRSRFRMAWTAVIVVSGFMVVGPLLGLQSWGATLHFVLLVWGLSAAIQPALAISVGLFSEERRNHTLELLYLTGMNTGELFVGKLLGAVLIASCDLLALFPFLAVPFLSGGISLDLFLATIACLPTVLLFLVAIGLLASAVCKDDGAALVLGCVSVGVISLALPIPYNIGQYLTGLRPFSSSWLCLSPAMGPYLVWKGAGVFNPGEFWASTGITLAWCVLILGLAALMLKRNWRQDVEGATLSGWKAQWESLAHGSSAWRSQLKERVLSKNPFQWLAEQDRRPMLLSWFSIAVISLLWLLGWLAWPRYWLAPVNLYSTALLLVLATGALRRYAAARRLAEDRRDGALELLLTSPVTPEDIVDGQAEALQSQFRSVDYGMLAVFTLLMTAGFLARRWNVQTAVTYIFVWAVFYYIWLQSRPWQLSRAAWIGLNTGRSTFAVTASARTSLSSIFWMLFNLRNAGGAFGGSLRGFPFGNLFELCLLIGFAVVVAIVLLFRYMDPDHTDGMRELLIKEMRSLAQEPVPDSKDPRFKKWKDMTRRFPPVES